MITLRTSSERGHANHGWLNTYHTFSFADYLDPKHMGFWSLRVINEDWVAAGRGFGTHPHNDMEILTWVMEGELEHRDSMGNGEIIRPGELQRMSAGTGVRHSEFNPSPTNPVHLFQIWILPDTQDLTPEYEQKEFPESSRIGKLQLLASPNGREGSLTIHQNVDLYTAILEAGNIVEHRFESGRHGWLQLAGGSLTVNGESLIAGDGAAISDEAEIELVAGERSEILLFDLA